MIIKSIALNIIGSSFIKNWKKESNFSSFIINIMNLMKMKNIFIFKTIKIVSLGAI
jgi:hypothetical protein